MSFFLSKTHKRDLGFLRAHWIIGPPFVDRKSLATKSNAKGVGQWWVANFVGKPLSPIMPLTRFPNVSCMYVCISIFYYVCIYSYIYIGLKIARKARNFTANVFLFIYSFYIGNDACSVCPKASYKHFSSCSQVGG
jgi:hypothetical protein